MAKRKDRERLEPFVPLLVETLRSPAWRALSHGARSLYIGLKARYGVKAKNNGRIFLSQRTAQQELGHGNRNDIANWYRELQHFGFVVQTSGGSLGVDGKGKAPHWRLTELGCNGEFPTKDFLRWDGTLFEPHRAPADKRRWERWANKQNPGLRVRSTPDSASGPLVDSASDPPDEPSGLRVRSIGKLH